VTDVVDSTEIISNSKSDPTTPRNVKQVDSKLVRRPSEEEIISNFFEQLKRLAKSKSASSSPRTSSTVQSPRKQQQQYGRTEEQNFVAQESTSIQKVSL